MSEDQENTEKAEGSAAADTPHPKKGLKLPNKVSLMNRRQVEHCIEAVRKQMGGMQSRFARHLLGRQEFLKNYTKSDG